MSDTYGQRSFRPPVTRRVRRANPVLIGFALAVTLVITIGIALFPSKEDAAQLARDKAGFTKVTSVSFQWFHLCGEGFVAYRVSGLRDGHPATVTACLSEISYFDHIR